MKRRIGVANEVASAGSMSCSAAGNPPWSSSHSSARKLLELGYAMPLMDEAVAQTAPISGASTNKTGWLVAIVLFGLLWLELINQLKAEWWLNPQYNYGLIVPLLALYLFWKRWRNRPAPAPPAANGFPIALILFCASLILLIRLFAASNPAWTSLR